MGLITVIADQLSQITEHMGKKYPDRKWLYEGRSSYWERLVKSKERGIPVVWAGVGGTPEIMAALGALPLSAGDFAAFLGILPGGMSKYVDIAERYVPNEMCCQNKVMIGLALSGEVPAPDFIVTTVTCDSGASSLMSIGDFFGVPSFCIDAPYGNSERDLQYEIDELRRLISFVEQATGHQLDINRVREVIGHANAAKKVFSEIIELRKIVPCPLPGRLLLLTQAMMNTLIGTPELPGYLKIERDMALENVRKGQGHLQNEKCRLAWVQIPISFDIGTYDWMEKEHGAIMVMDYLDYWKMDPIDDSDMSHTLRGWARMLLDWPMLHGTRGPADYWIDSMIKMCKEYKADAAVCSGHVGCKRYWAATALLKDRIADELGIPTLVFDFDAFDPRVRSSETIRGWIEEFLKMIPGKG
jgi:benzoyl-CoA reductase subunit B